jgi:two-component system sensor histidine kinase BaeS
MKSGITFKLFLALFLAASLAVLCSTLVMQWNLHRGFLKLVNTIDRSALPRLAARLEEQYRNGVTWEAIRRDPMEWRLLIDASLPELVLTPEEEMKFGAPPPGGGRPFRPPPPGGEMPFLLPHRLPGSDGSRPRLPHQLVRQFDQRLFLLDAERRIIIGRPEPDSAAEVIPLHKQGKLIGYLGLRHQEQLPDSPQRGFLKEQKLAFAIVAGVVVLLSALLSLLLATRLVRPLKKITEATHGLAQGTYSVRVPVVSDDELGRLATDFNTLALAMENNEKARRQWVADISHELRTPLTFLRSQVEAILDGVRQPTTEAMQAMHHEIMRFKRLVDDLYQLSMSDVGAQTYRKEEVAVSAILADMVAIHRPHFMAKNIDLVCEAPEEKFAIFGDAERLGQLFGNLLDNSLKYTDPGGMLRIQITRDDGRVFLDFQDSDPAVPEPELDKLFDRLYRVDSSRNRSSGGAGLGLAICRNIVEAHEGIIEARTSPLGGVWIRVNLPCRGRG